MANQASPTPRSSPAAATPEAIAEAGRLIRAGRLVAFPTETVYGLGADATDDRAVAGIFAAKDRPRFNPLIVHVTDVEAAAAHAALTPSAKKLAEVFWPGPLSLVVPRRPDCRVSRLACAGLATIALRAPAHAVAQALLRAAERPIAAPSANPSGRLSPTRAEHVAALLGDRVDLVLDGGPSPLGIESTVLDASGDGPPELLRLGALPRETIEELVGPLGKARPGDRAAASAPGMLGSHYAPAHRLRLDAAAARPDEALLAFGAEVPRGGAVVRNLSPRGDLREAAGNFFAMLHELDRAEVSGIAVMPIPERGLGEAINDRLRRAAGT